MDSQTQTLSRRQRLLRLSRLPVAVAAIMGGAFMVAQKVKTAHAQTEQLRKEHIETVLPTRDEQISRLKSGKRYDILVIGGGATGAGIALDAATRGLNVALVEKDDFAAATSSRSTKLIHGGVRYLEAAVKKLDPRQLSLVFDALHERATFLNNAPHLTRKIPIMTPCYSWWEIPYYWVGLKMYDLLSLNRRLAPARYVSRKESLLQFPMLKDKNLKGSVVYYDGQMDDSRMNVGLAITAAMYGASVANHVEVVNLLKENRNGRDVVSGATVRDTLSNETWDISADIVVNATGPYVDAIRRMDDPNAPAMVTPSRGIHITLPDYYSPVEMGLIVPKTPDGRVIFLLPWLGKTLAGTTDSPTELDADPKAREEEINYLLDTIANYVSIKVRREDVSAAWSGIRPLAKDPTATNTASVVRDHVISVSDSNLLTITGGKWTTYRSMAQEAVDRAIELGGFKHAGPCVTANTLLLGAAGWHKSQFLQLAQNYRRLKQGRGKYSDAPLNTDIAIHLSQSYGTRSHLVCELAQQGYGKRLAHNHPYIEAEVIYAARHEYAATAVDVIARRLRLAFLDIQAAQQALPRVIELMAQELNWDAARIEAEHKNAQEFLRSMC